VGREIGGVARVTGAGLRTAFAAALKVSGHRTLRMKMDDRPLRATRRVPFFPFSTVAALVLVLLRPIFPPFFARPTFVPLGIAQIA